MELVSLVQFVHVDEDGGDADEEEGDACRENEPSFGARFGGRVLGVCLRRVSYGPRGTWVPLLNVL